MSQAKPITIKLTTPIKRGDKHVTELVLRKPDTGALRGLKIIDLMNIDVTALGILLTRIATPSITMDEFNALDPADTTQIGAEVAGFFTV